MMSSDTSFSISARASIDPGLIKMLEYSPVDARTDMSATMLLILAIILMFTLPIFYVSYSPAEGAVTMYQFMPYLLAIVPISMTVKLLAGRFRGTAEPASKKLLWSVLSSGVQALGIITFLIISPFSVRYVLGDLCMKTNNLLAAEYWYKNALSVVPDNIDVTFDLALLYREKGEYEAALSCLEKGSTK